MKGLLGHSDADVLIHAVMDALLGAAALGDIGQHFPDTDPAYKGISSVKLLTHVMELLRQHHFAVGNVDAVIIAQKPKMAPHIPQMRKNLAQAMGVEEDRINIKATTEEGAGLYRKRRGNRLPGDLPSGRSLKFRNQATAITENRTRRIGIMKLLIHDTKKRRIRAPGRGKGKNVCLRTYCL